jgi:alkaline phosphatase
MTDATRSGRSRPTIGLSRAIAIGALACVASAASPPADASAFTVTIAGDIATCEGDGDSKTAAIVRRQPGIVMTAGDNAYESGTPRQFRRCYHPTWGQFRARTRPALGNHDWQTEGAAGYFRYFGKRAGPAGRGYYSFKTGGWRIYVLDTTRCQRGRNDRSGCGRSSGQYRWLKRHLAAHPSRCTLVVGHHPRFSSGVGGNNEKVAPLLWLLYRAGAELVINGHDHNYERFAPARPDGTTDLRHGMRQIIAGAGGARLTPFRKAPRSNSVHRTNASHGVLRLGLGRGHYSWQYLRTDGRPGDRGKGTCHGRP